MAQLPIKFRTLQLIEQNPGIDNGEILALLKQEYPHDRFVTAKGVTEYLLSLKAVGLIEPVSICLNAAGDLIQAYKVTESGKSRMKYVN